jgi:O-glycosyl hydrolase
MIKYLIITCLIAITSHLFATETVLLDFESATVPVSVSSWLNYSETGTEASTWAAPNPGTDVINSTTGCYKIVKSSEDPYWTGMEVTMANSVSITAKNQFLHVLVLKNTNSRIALTYTAESGSQSTDDWQLNATTGAWIDYMLAIPIGTRLKTFSIKIGDDEGDYYFDQISLSNEGTSASPVTIVIDPLQKYQIIEGWGTSLCWWANVMGGFSDAKVKTICDWITDPAKGLNMNIFRFNIGGGDAPDHNHMRTDGGDMPGYRESETAEYDWDQDSNQRKILQQLIASRIDKAGVNDIQLVAFSNSPPYWMTVSGCSAGSVEGNVCNLKSDMFDDFAGYLTDVTMHYHDDLGITFNYIEPFNEPDANWWKALGGQEGCYFSNSQQMTMIRELYQKLEEKNMLSYCQINANDANSLNNGLNALNAYSSAGDIVSKLGLVSVHSYGGNNRTGLASWAQNNNKKLWQSESGPLYVGDSYESQLMIMADRTITDLRDLKCTGWCDWQLGGGGDLSNPWAQIVSDYNDDLNPIARNTNYYMRAQFSRYIKPGYTIIESSADNSVAAISPDEKELIVIISNSKLYTQNYTVDLADFSDFGKVVQFRTRAQESLGIKNSEDRFTITGNSFDSDVQSESVTTFIIPVNQGTSANEIKENAGNLYYSDGTIYTNFPNVNTISISIYNIAGQFIETNNQIPGQGSCQFNLTKGIYLIYTIVNNSKIIEKIVVSN